MIVYIFGSCRFYNHVKKFKKKSRHIFIRNRLILHSSKEARLVLNVMLKNIRIEDVVSKRNFTESSASQKIKNYKDPAFTSRHLKHLADASYVILELGTLKDPATKKIAYSYGTILDDVKKIIQMSGKKSEQFILAPHVNVKVSEKIGYLENRIELEKIVAKITTELGCHGFFPSSCFKEIETKDMRECFLTTSKGKIDLNHYSEKGEILVHTNLCAFIDSLPER